MTRLSICLSALLATMMFGLTTPVWAIGFELGKSKAELKLKYTIEVTDHGTGRVTAVLTLENAGAMTPLTGVQFVVPKETSESDRSSGVDLSITVAPDQGNDSARYRVHLRREWGQRGEFQLRTRTLDGKEELRTWYYHRIPLSEQSVKWK